MNRHVLLSALAVVALCMPPPAVHAPAANTGVPSRMEAVAPATGSAVGAEAAQDTTHYTVIIDGHHKAERLVLDADGLPVKMDISGEVSSGVPWNERFELEDGTARWFRPRLLRRHQPRS